jgi:hypothetical protein
VTDAFSTASPIVSIVMPVHNTETYLADSVNSILSQSFLDRELRVASGRYIAAMDLTTSLGRNGCAGK